MLEELEDRTVLSPTVFTVTSTGDSSTDSHTSSSGDLRYCVGLANANTSNPAGSLVQFDPTVFSSAQTITLGSGLELTNTADQTTITGPTAALTVSGGGTSSDFSVLTLKSGVTAMISGLTISNGNVPLGAGGGINNMGTLTLSNVAVSGNSVPGTTYESGASGGIYNDGTLTLSDVTVSGNSSSGRGGGLSNYGTATMTNVTISGNTGAGGGGIYNTGTLTLSDVTISNKVLPGLQWVGVHGWRPYLSMRRA